MECSWDDALLQCGDQLPPELLDIIRTSSNEHYLESITKAAHDPRYIYTLFAHCEPLFPHISARLRHHGSLASSIATLGRIISFAPYLSVYAQNLLKAEQHRLGATSDSDEDLAYLLGLFRLCDSDWRTFSQYVDPAEISELLHCPRRPVVYLAIRVLQLYLQGADHWFETMIKRYLGEDSPETAIEGPWDDISIDYRFLTLWEQERHQMEHDSMTKVRSLAQQVSLAQCTRVLPSQLLDPSTALIGGSCLPRSGMHEPQSSSRRDIVETATVRRNLQNIAKALKSSQPALLMGLPGSGKTMLIEHAAAKLGKLDTMVTLHLNAQTDAKLLIGIYTTGDTPGSFVWKPGVLTTAVQEGRWVLIEDLDRAPNEVVGILLPLIEKGELLIANRKQTVHTAQGFRIIATIRSAANHREESGPFSHMLGARLWQGVCIEMPTFTEQQEVAGKLFPSLQDLLPQFMAVFERLHAARQKSSPGNTNSMGLLRSISPRDLLKLCSRVVSLFKGKISFTSNDIDNIFLEAVDCFLGSLYDSTIKIEMAAVVAEELHIDPQRCNFLLAEREAQYTSDKGHIKVGRYQLSRAAQTRRLAGSDGVFSTNTHTSRMLERVAAAVVNREPLLLVGETGVGKTTAVQHLAGHLGKKLVPFNLSQQSEAGDLLGGFKPVNARTLIIPMKDEFDELFPASFSISKNQEFLELLGKQVAKGNWKAVCKLWQRALKMVDQQRTAVTSATGETPSKKRKVQPKRAIDLERWDAFSAKVSNMEQRLAAGSEAFAFSFVEGAIVKAVRNGDWILLDEINLASMDTLESIADLLDPSSPSIMLTEAGNVERVRAHPDFRIFAAMNPATDVGKKDLPPGIRSRFTELYVESPDKDIRSLQSIVRSYLRHEAAADQAVSLDVSTLYQKLVTLSEQNKLVDGAGQKPHFSLRTLTRTLSYAKYIAPLCNLRRALYEGFQMSFLTFLDGESAGLVQPLLEQHLFGKRTNVRAELQKCLRKPADGHDHVQGWPGSRHWVRRGALELKDQSEYILTPFIRRNIENLVRAVSTRQFPVLIQGPTSSGKTSMIEYLAKRTGHEFVRINNHEHTDLQEYLGTYISGSDGKLQFQEGILVKALREGHWIVLDELNLAPTDVLEALNRLLDDNRELLVPEMQEVVRPHENFMLFATQNPAGPYGGRKTLSRAFRNRFLELHFDDIPIEELQEILHQRTKLPESRCKRVVAVYRELSVLRQETRLFEQKSFATLRDLFRWALRPNDTIEQMAANGFMLLAERVRKVEERQILKGIIEKAMSANGPPVKIDEQALYARDCTELLQHQGSAESHDVVWTKAMRRLYVLVSRAIANNEPVLLVGETGCGKTTVCQMLADALRKKLHTVNAHQNTETGDLIGSQRPIRNRAVIEANLHQQLLDVSFMQSLNDPAEQTTAELLDAYDRAVAALSEDEQSAQTKSLEHQNIQSSRTRVNALFQWTDGSLVQAMREGSFFLLDEISLADDSVLERINSVLEPQRSILLAEKGSLDSFVTAATDFQFFATMNPGGDYGKRELSPALRNRFTEIWVPSLNDADDVIEIVVAKLLPAAKPFADAIVAFAQWFKQQYNASASSSVSIRDALAWVSFINAAAGGDVRSSVIHGAAMVYIDTLGANPAGLMMMTKYSLNEERRSCLAELSRLLQTDACATYSAPMQVHSSEDRFTVGGFHIAKRRATSSEDLGFSFDAPTTKVNAMRVVRALQLPKPVMLEGNPGVGKTALVTAIADAVCVPLTRINLSEQTDLIDLFGSDIPVEGAETGSFTWRDAPFLRAMKNGEWVLLDEMNLASQSVLEGLNACLDHRGKVFVPELGQTFTRHPDFRLFAAQNPHHQGGGRKGLPASFVNRFTVVYADAFKPEDLMLICRRRFPSLDEQLIAKAVGFVEQLEHGITNRMRAGANGGPWEFNLRDVSRWLALASSSQGLLRSGSTRDFVEFLFSQRFRSSVDQAVVSKIFERIFDGPQPRADLFSSTSKQALQLGLGLLPRSGGAVETSQLSRLATHITRHARILESLLLCVQQNWPVILTGASGVGKTALIERLATAVGAPLVTIAMNAETDAMDLVGGYEQADSHRRTFQAVYYLRQQLLGEVRIALAGDSGSISTNVLALLQRCESAVSSDKSDIVPLVDALRASSRPKLQKMAESLQETSTTVDKARFEWIDGLLVDALQEGKWLVLDNANLCSSSVLDRLNSLLEPNGTLIINEHSTDEGAARVIQPHPSFRIFLTMDPRYGELSRAMRNRAVELHLSKDNPSTGLDPLFTESAVARLRSFKLFAAQGAENLTDELMLTLRDHMAALDQPLLARFQRQLDAGLYGGGQIPAMASFAAQTELVQQAQSFNASTISQLQGPADFANVQTLHPLNNQPLICTSPQTLHQASSLAYFFDLRVSIATMHRLLDDLRADATLIKQLRRLEQDLPVPRSSANKKSKQSRSITLLSQVVACFAAFAESFALLPEIALQRARILVGYLQAIWAAVHESLRTRRFDAAAVTSFMRIANNVIRSHSETGTPELSALLPRLADTFSQLLVADHDTRGLGCTALWQVFRPTTPATMDQLRELVEFETLVNLFDGLCRTPKIARNEAAGLRRQLSLALRVARHGGRDLAELTEKLQGLGLGARSSVEEEGQRLPHLLPTFRRINERFASVRDDQLLLPESDLAKLEALALQPTVRSRLASRRFRGHTIPSRSLTVEGGGDNAWSRAEATLPSQIATVAQVPLADLEAFTSETQVLGKILSTQAHVLSSSELDSLDQCLDAVFSEFLTGLQGSQDGTLADLTAAALHHEIIGSVDSRLDWGVQTLHGVAQYLKGPLDCLNKTRAASAAHAWASFALVALHLYLPAAIFDPALEPLLRLSLHKRQRNDLSNKSQALRMLRTAITGEGASLRARMVEEDIAALGPEPEAAVVCRPEVSELSRLQAEFDALSRTLEPLCQGLQHGSGESTLDATTLANIERTKTRLRTQYRAYDDLTEPVVLFIDCLCIGNDLALQLRDSVVDAQNMHEFIPFVDASPSTWKTDTIFLWPAATTYSVSDEIQWLTALALRCKVRPLHRCSGDLRRRVDEAFQKFHAAWASELSVEQKKHAAKSSLYKFKGNDEDQNEVSQDDLDEVFPDGSSETSATNSPAATSMQEQASAIARLHALLYSSLGSQSEGDAMTLLRQWMADSSTDPFEDRNRHLIPATIFSVGELNASLAVGSLVSRHYNMYTDSNPAESRRLNGLLQRTKRRFEELQSAWPEHATPGDVLVLCSQALATPYLAPLPRFFPMLEKLHFTVTEWQKIASREYSAADVLEELTNTIISWRQLELSTWAGIFDRERDQCQKSALSWWFVAYESIVAAGPDTDTSSMELQKHAEGLLKTLSGFVSVSGLGEYSARLQLLRTFENELKQRDDPLQKPLHDALYHFVAYFATFEAPITEALNKGRTDLEKDAKNIIQVASWKDRNIDTLRQSAQSSHRKLLRLVKKYRNLLSQPVTAIIGAGLREIAGPGLPSTTLPLRPAQSDHAGRHVENTGIEVWDQRAERFQMAQRTADLVRSKIESLTRSYDAANQVQTFTAQLEKDIASLQKATPSMLTEENKTLVNHLKTRKRRLFADVLKEVRAMGFQTSLSVQALSSQASTDQILAKLPAPASKPDGNHIDHGIFELYRLIDIMPTVRQSARSHVEDLTPAEVSRSATLLESMLHQCTLQYTDFSSHASACSDFEAAKSEFVNFVGCEAPRKQSAPLISDTRESLASVLLVLPVCIRTLSHQMRMASLDYTFFTATLEEYEGRAHQLHERGEALFSLPIGWESTEHVSFRQAFEVLQTEVNDSIKAAIAVHPEVEPVMAQLLRWTASGETASREILMNGHADLDKSSWLTKLLEMLDRMLAGVQEAGKIQGRPDIESAWLVTEQQLLSRALVLLRVPTVTTNLRQLQSQLQYLGDSSGGGFSQIATICRSVLPILESYSQAILDLTALQSTQQAQTAKTAYKLATTLTTLCQKGFCTPSEKSDDKNDSEGNVENGTGLGEGEGADDISKDIAPDEDLSELAQEAQRDKAGDKIEEQKDAVDMADEDLGGEVGDGGEPEDSEDGNASGDDTEEDHDVDEEAGDVDDEGPGAVDEKMWDSGKDENQREKETDAGAGQQAEDHAAAGKEDGEHKDGEGQEDADQDTEAGAQETEDVQREMGEQVDPHTRDEENLDLPEDMTMDDKKNMDGDDSDVDSIPDANDDMPDVGEHDGEHHEQDGPVDEESNEQDNVEDRGDQMQAGEETAEEDAASDILMQHDEQPETNADPQSNADVSAEVGSGPGHAESSEQDGGQGETSSGTEAKERPTEEQESAQEPDSTTGQANGEAPTDGDDDGTQEKLPFKQIGDALHEWYNQNADIEKAQKPDQGEQASQMPQQPASMQFQHLPSEDAQADTQALGTASAEESMALDKNQALPVDDEKEATDMPFQDAPDENVADTDAEEEMTADAMQLEPSDKLRAAEQSNAFVGEPRDGDVEMTDEVEMGEEDDVNDVDQQLLETHISREEETHEPSIDEARKHWATHEENTRNLALMLTEHLRLILQPTQATKMRGDFRTGKRLNIKRIIPYIASSYKRDKIWMRRSVPSKRAYQVMLAIDDSKSMMESDSRHLAFETLAMVTKSLSTLEVGELSVVGFGQEVKVAHDFGMPFTSDAGAEIFKSLTFSQNKTDIRKLLAESIELFRAARLKASSSASDLWQLQLIVSDGICEDDPRIRQLARQAHEERLMIVFIVVDAAAQQKTAESGTKQSILDLQRAEFVKDDSGQPQLKMNKYLDTFPFRYYLIVRDVQELPGVLAGALRQWFAEVVETGN